jgi:hypothetical protein
MKNSIPFSDPELTTIFHSLTSLDPRPTAKFPAIPGGR